MSAINIREEDPLILRLLLPEADTSKFVRAIIVDKNNTPLTGSPFTLTSIGGGRYFFKDEINLIFPIGAFAVYAKYEIFDDAGFTVPSIEYAQASDTWISLTDTSSELMALVDDLKDFVRDITPIDTEIHVLEDDDEITIFVE